jgi:predicted dehydrogenase
MAEIKWGLIGCGDISRNRVAPGITNAKNSKLIAVNRFDFTKAESFAKEFGARKWIKNWKDLVEDHDIDAVYIATPVHLHAEQTIAAAEAGKHVLCEKPMSMNASESKRMIDASKANNVKLGIAYYRNHYPVIEKIKKIISSYEIGKIVYIQSNNFENFNREPGEPMYWAIEKKKSGGGPMMGTGCHRIEVFINIAGPISQVTGFNNNIVFKREVEDSSIAHFKFTNGAEGLLTSSHAAKEPRDTLDIYGSEGSIHVPVLNEGILTVRTQEGERTEKYPNTINVHLPLIEDFISAVLNDHEPSTNGIKGREISRITDEIYKG